MTGMIEQHLLLIRHAKTLPAAAHQSDSERALAERGHHQTEQMRSYLRSLTMPIDATVLCSPAQRTRQTLDGCLPDHADQSIHFLDDIYMAYTGDLLALLNQRLISEPGWLIVIGHNPSLDSLLRWLGQSSSQAAAGMATGCIAYLRGTAPLLPDNWRVHDWFKPAK